MSNIDWNNYGRGIADNSYNSTTGEVRDVAAIVEELKEIEAEFCTHAMSEHALFLQGKKQMMSEIIEYLERC